MKVTAEVAASLRTLQKCHLKSQKKMARIRTKISTAAALATEVAPLLRALQKCHSQMAHIGVKIAKGADAALATLAAEAREDSRRKSPSTSRLTPSRWKALSMRCIDVLIAADVPICVAQENPKAGRSRERYALSISATSCSAYLRLGGNKTDLQNDVVKGHVVLDGFADFSRHPIVASTCGP
ncbi:hypothetical protein M885DRAFT_623164 [Pelagophyceae sp. CCMP2097]|nr:hypothetical protein M885DRAFT_623164 [Pelagophyceae sp. CCMP2097]